MTELSVVIITLNEERNIGRCLESVKDIADDIVVVDSFSTDDTEKICREHGVRFIQHVFEGHIEQKNWAISQAKFPHILSVDADEMLSDRLKTSIRDVKENWKYDGYYFNRLTNYCGKWIRHSSWYPSRKLRLWDKEKGCWGGINPHDNFILNRGASKKHLKGDLLHYSYYSIHQHIEQINKFSEIAARALREVGRRASWFDIIFHPSWRLFRDYIIKLGFLDGYYGFIVTATSAYEVFLKYVKLRDIYKEEHRSRKQIICFFNSMDSWGGGEKWHYDVAVNLSKQNLAAYYISSPGSPLSDKFREIGLRGSEIKISNLSFLNPFKVLRIARIFRREHVGVLITSLSGDMKVAGISGKIAGVPEIIYRRGSAIPVNNTPLNRYMFRKVITRILANSHEVKRTILANNELLVEQDKIKIIYNGVNLSKYGGSTPPIFKASDGEIVLGSGGRLSDEKGHCCLIDLLKELEGNGIDFIMLIAGEGQLLNQLQKRAKKLGVERQLHFLGFVEDMPAFFNSLDIFLLTSRYEGFSNVIPEAMASRKPVVLFDIKSSSEIIEHGETGYITEQEDIKAMAEHVLELAKSRELRDAMGARGRAVVEEQFSFDQKYKEILKLITPR